MNQALQTLEQTVAEGSFAGRKFRYTNDTPRKVSVIDWIVLITGKEAVYAKRLFQIIKKSTPDVVQRIVLLQFQGQGQRPTPVASATDLVYILGKLPKKYIEKFESERDSLVTRYLGGDTSLNAEVSDIRRVQENIARADPNHPLRVFGEAVESGAVGNLVSDEEAKRNLATWNEVRDESKIAYRVKVDALKSESHLNKKSTHIHMNKMIGYAVTGMYPKMMKQVLEIPQGRSARDHMSSAQLGGVVTMEQVLARQASTARDATSYTGAIEEISKDFHDLFKKYEVHGIKDKTSGRHIKDAPDPNPFMPRLSECPVYQQPQMYRPLPPQVPMLLPPSVADDEDEFVLQ